MQRNCPTDVLRFGRFPLRLFTLMTFINSHAHDNHSCPRGFKGSLRMDKRRPVAGQALSLLWNIVRKTGTTRARFPVCDCFSNVCLTHMDGTENHSRNDLIPLVRLRIRCDHSRNRMSTQDTYLRNANQVCKARKPRSYCSLMFEHFMVDCSALLKQVPNSFGFETCYGWRPFARLVVAGCHPDTA